MALIVEDGTSKIDSESYASVADADDYWALRVIPATWDEADVESKEIMLRTATEYLDAEYEGCWKGQRSDHDQSLAWPRIGVVDVDDHLVEFDEMPRNLKSALIILASKLIPKTFDGSPDFGDAEDTLLPDDELSETGITKISDGVGPLKSTVEYGFPKSSIVGKQYSFVERLLKTLIICSGISVKVHRA